MKLKIGNNYFISFMDSRSPDYTWYSGTGVLLGKHDDDFGEKEHHYIFRLPNGDECIFPKSSVIRRIK
jgi:hypothetical protein